MKIAICQLRSSDDPYLNLQIVHDYVKAAEAAGVEIVFFPENVFYRGPKKSATFNREEIYLELDAGGGLLGNTAWSSLLNDYANEWKIFVSLGSVFEKVPASPMPFNSHFCWNPISHQFTSYRKIHLFDYQSSTGSQYRESAEVQSGVSAHYIQVGLANVGLSICYDLRFPELYRHLVLCDNCKIISVPAAFTQETGQAHWHALLKARAIENQVFVVAAGQWGTHMNSAGNELSCFGNSSVYSPWGDLIYCCYASQDHLEVLDLDLKTVESIRDKLPAIYGAKFFHSIVSK